MPAPPLIIASDLDGTLLRSDGTVSDRTRAALGAVQDAGGLVVLVTGRPPRWMHDIAQQTGHAGLAICANGALVYDLADERVVRTDPLDVEGARAVVAALRAELPGAVFAVERGDSFGHEPGYEPRVRIADLRRAPVEELLDAPLVKLLVRTDPAADGDELLRRATAVLGDLATVTRSMDGGLLEISAAGVSKASALARLVADAGGSSEVVTAFGDMPNDLPMLEWAGRAVAMANGHPAVQELADEVTATNDEDGVALVVERLLAG